MPKLKIDGVDVEVESGLSILQACETIGVEIPRFCYHERLSIAGNCRMCLVEMEGSNKPVASCAMPVTEGMNIKTKSEFVKKARNGVMEFLLINHPLDCPICDQGGECDLQDQAIAYGSGISRFIESKRAVKDKDLGPLIKTHMTRCIHCTRCVRFAEEIAGVEQLGTVGRGEETEITSFLEEAIDSEMSGNLIDLCPVGALTSKPYAFIARPWELKKFDTIDVMDAIGSNIRMDIKDQRIMRVLPRINESINEEWISDKTRFAYDGILSQRIDRPYIKKNGKFLEIDYQEAINIISKKIKENSIDTFGALLGNIVDCETALSFKLLLEKLNCNNFDCRQDNSFFVPGERSSYLFNSQISGIESSDLCLLIGCNPKLEASVLNARIRQKSLNSDFNYTIARIGEKSKLNYEVIELGEKPDVLDDLIKKRSSFNKILQKAKMPIFIIGQGALCRSDSKEIYLKARNLYQSLDIDKNWNGFNILQTFAGRVGALDINFFSKQKDIFKKDNLIKKVYAGKINLLYLYAADEIDFNNIPEKTFIIYHGHHADKGAQKADLIIPTSCYTEKEGIFINAEGRSQISYQVKEPLLNVKHAWSFFIDLAKSFKINLGYSNFDELRRILFNLYPHTQNIDLVEKTSFIKSKKSSGAFSNETISSNIKNFYMTDSVSRLSKVMAECSKKIVK